MLRLPRLLGLILALSPVATPRQTTDDCHRLTVVVTALDMAGLPVKDLPSATFKGTYRGRPVNILSSKFIEGYAPRIVALLDMSGSMRGGRLDDDRNKWRSALTAASELVSSAPASTQISLFIFASKVERRFELLPPRLRAPMTTMTRL